MRKLIEKPKYTEEEQSKSDFDLKEKRFEQDIEEYLITEGGYAKGDPSKFDRKLALDTESFLRYISLIM